MYNSVDVICAALLVILGLFGYHTGAIASIFYAASGFAGVFIAHKYAAALHVNFIVLFAAVTVGLIAFGMVSRAMARLFMLGFIDRLAGFLIGALLGCVVISISLEPVGERVSEPVKNKIHSSYTAKRLAPAILARIPALKDLHDIKFNLPDKKNLCR